MALCPHGYTMNWDCPECACPCGSGLPAGECRCIAPPKPQPSPEAYADTMIKRSKVMPDWERASRTGAAADFDVSRGRS